MVRRSLIHLGHTKRLHIILLIELYLKKGIRKYRGLCMRWTFIFVGLLSAALSQSQPNPFITYTPRDGLVSARVRSSYQDSKGRIYFLTYGGLSVYDGVRFKNYTMQDGLTADMVNDVMEVGHDSLLIATNTSPSLHLLNRNRIENFPLAVETTPTINKFLIDEAGDIYMTADDGLFRLDSQQLYKFELPQLADGVLPYLGILCDAGPYLLFTTNELKNNRGLYLFDKESGTIVDFIKDVVVFGLIKDPGDRIWLVNLNQLSLIDPASLQQGKLHLLNSNTIHPHGNGKILNIAFGNSVSWAFHPENQLEINRNGKSIIMDLSALNNMGGVTSMMVDKEQILWICTDGGGVIKISPPQFNVLKLSYGNEHAIRIENVTSTTKDTWHHTFDGHIYHSSGGKLKPVSETYPVSSRIMGPINDTLYARDKNTIYTAEILSDNSLGISTVFQKYDSTFFTGEFIVHPDRGIFCGSDQGLMHLHLGRSVVAYPVPNIDVIEYLLIDREDFLWMVSRYSGIVKFSFTPGDSGQLVVSKTFPLGHLQISPRTAAMDDRGLLWIGSRYEGIYVLDVRGDTIKIVKRFDSKSGLTDNFITCLQQCPDGSMLVGTQSGLDRILPSEKDQYRVENLTKRSNSFAFISDIWIEEDKIFALTNTGNEIEVLPFDNEQPLFAPQLLIDDVKVNGLSVLRDKTEFDHHENNFVISISAPTYVDEKQVQYSYKLTGSGKSDWSEASPAHGNINLLNLRPGKYTLMMRATFPSTFYEPAESQYHFTIRPAWWQTTFARIVLILVAVFISGLVMYFFYKRKLERQQSILEKQHAIQEERARISGDLHDDLGAGLSTIRFLVEKIKQANELIPMAPLDRIQNTSDELTDKMNEIIWAMSEKNDTVGDLLSYTRSYIATYCDEHNLSCHLQFPQEIPHTVVSGRIRRNVFLIIKESLHNILKHSDASNVYIDIRLNHNLHISIRDDGKGVTDRALNQKSGHGFHNMQKRISSMGGTLSVTNDPGAVVEFSVPLNQG